MLSILNTLINCDIYISDKDNLKEEKKTSQKILHNNGYTTAQINKAYKKQASKIGCQNVPHIVSNQGE